jgi:hypothetical protein
MLVSFLGGNSKYIRCLFNQIMVYIQAWLYTYSSSLHMCQENDNTVRKVAMENILTA